MLFSLKFSYILLCLLIQIQGGLPVSCYYCNSRDNPGCNSLKFGDNNSYLKTCDGPCSTIKGQFGFSDKRVLLLWRGCGEIKSCSQEMGLCCHCKDDGCNYGNTCFVSTAHVPVVYPIFFIFIYLTLLFC